MPDRDTAVIQIEKAVHLVDGAYPAMNQSFVQHEWSHVTFINREQDLGLAGQKKPSSPVSQTGLWKGIKSFYS